jgi:hypothetical protein
MPKAMTLHRGQTISRSALEKMMREAQRAKSAMARYKDQAEEVVHTVVRTSEIAIAGAALGAVRATYGRVVLPFGGIPIAAALAGGGHLAAFLIGGETAKHIRGFADGGVAVLAYEGVEKLVAEARLRAAAEAEARGEAPEAP